MAITVAQLQSDLDAARTAIAAGDLATAERYCLQAQAVLAGIPDGEIGGSRMEWRSDIEALLRGLGSSKATAGVSATGGRRNYAEFVAPQ